MSKRTYNNIGRKLYQLRLELGLTQNDVAERCNMSVNYWPYRTGGMQLQR